MKTRNLQPMLLVLACLAISSFACNSDTTDTAELPPTASSTPTQTAPSASPTTPLRTTETPVGGHSPDWKRDLFLAEGGGRVETCIDAEFPPPSELPAIRVLYNSLSWLGQGRRRLCLYGFPVGEQIDVRLQSAKGTHAASASFRMNVPESGESETFLHHLPEGEVMVTTLEVEQLKPRKENTGDLAEHWAGIVDDVAVLEVYLWWPVVLPAGEWIVAAVAPGAALETKVHLEAASGISTRPNADVDPFVNHHCDEYAIGDEVLIEGVGLDPEQTQGLGIYWYTSDYYDMVAYLIDVLQPSMDSEGSFDLELSVPASYGSGTFIIVPGPDPARDRVMKGLQPCFRVVALPDSTLEAALRIVFVSERTGSPQIWLMNADGSGQVQLTQQGDNRGPQWSPDNREILFETNRDGVWGTYTMNADGTGQRPLERTGQCVSAGYSWRGRLSYACLVDDNWELFVESERITNNDTDDRLYAWSPLDDRIIFEARREGDSYRVLMRVHASGDGLVGLTDSGYLSWNVTWSPDAARLAFASNRDGNARVFTMLTDGTGWQALTPRNRWSQLPAWSPDGRWISFVSSDTDEVWSLYRIDTNGDRQILLSRYAHPGQLPAWSHDSVRLAFSGNADGDFEIYVVNHDGTELIQLTSNRSDDHSPQWSR